MLLGKRAINGGEVEKEREEMSREDGWVSSSALFNEMMSYFIAIL